MLAGSSAVQVRPQAFRIFWLYLAEAGIEGKLRCNWPGISFSFLLASNALLRCFVRPAVSAKNKLLCV